MIQVQPRARERRRRSFVAPGPQLSGSEQLCALPVGKVSQAAFGAIGFALVYLAILVFIPGSWAPCLASPTPLAGQPPSAAQRGSGR